MYEVQKTKEGPENKRSRGKGIGMGSIISNLLITKEILSSVKYKEKSTIDN